MTKGMCSVEISSSMIETSTISEQVEQLLDIFSRHGSNRADKGGGQRNVGEDQARRQDSPFCEMTSVPFLPLQEVMVHVNAGLTGFRIYVVLMAYDRSMQYVKSRDPI